MRKPEQPGFVSSSYTCPSAGEDIDVSKDEVAGVIRELLGAPASAGVAGVGEM